MMVEWVALQGELTKVIEAGGNLKLLIKAYVHPKDFSELNACVPSAAAEMTRMIAAEPGSRSQRMLDTGPNGLAARGIKAMAARELSSLSTHYPWLSWSSSLDLGGCIAWPFDLMISSAWRLSHPEMRDWQCAMHHFLHLATVTGQLCLTNNASFG
jgi:hypothetical protein